MRRKQVVNTNHAQSRPTHDFQVVPARPLDQLHVMPWPPPTRTRHIMTEEFPQRRWSFKQSSSVDSAENRNVPSETQRREIKRHESGFVCEIKLPHEPLQDIVHFHKNTVICCRPSSIFLCQKLFLRHHVIFPLLWGWPMPTSGLLAVCFQRR